MIPEKSNDAGRWLTGEISLGKFIHNSGLETCYAQASDFAGGIANWYDDRARNVYDRIQSKIKKAEADYSTAETEADKTAEAARKRALVEALSDLQFELGRALP